MTARHNAEPPSFGGASGTAEHVRLAESPAAGDPWRTWGTYLAGRQWGTVREDYSADGDAWASFGFDESSQRAYRWGEDGLGGLSDRSGFLNFSVALWNGQDDRLKERLFGLTNPQGNHGEDVKEYWWAVDATPTHSYAHWLYRYPQSAFPYADLIDTNGRRGRDQPEYELSDTGVLAQDRFFDIAVRYAKAAPTDICIRISATNHGPESAPLDVLPQLWFHNTWAWGGDDRRPLLRRVEVGLPEAGHAVIEAEHAFLGRYVLLAESTPGALPSALHPGQDLNSAHGSAPSVLMCANETNRQALYGQPNEAPFTKDGIEQRVVHGNLDAVNPDGSGTKAAFWYHFPAVAPGQTVTVQLRLTANSAPMHPFGSAFDAVFEDRRREADEFYAAVIGNEVPAQDAHIARRAFAGLLWGKQIYRYSVAQWLTGDPAPPRPDPARLTSSARNVGWRSLSLADVMSMPDEWEYPWFASWDLAFHCVTLAHIDPAFAKDQLALLCREWVMHPNGQLPAYEWEFSDVNPPVHAWAAWQVYQVTGATDHEFLLRIFSKLIVNFSWWINRKDADGSNLFEGGFLGMDNIGLFDRSAPPPEGYRLEQSDATSWMAFYCLQMLQIALELSRTEPAWSDMAIKFVEHFLAISAAMSEFGSRNIALWDADDGFFYDVLVGPDGSYQQLKVRSIVGLLPLLAIAVAEDWVATELTDFTDQIEWLQRRRPWLTAAVLFSRTSGSTHVTLSLLDPDRLNRLLHRALDESEFLSPFGIRSLSAAYRVPYTENVRGSDLTIQYNPGESDNGLFGGNSNWRGPIWFPVNVLLADALGTFATAFGSTAEFPTGSGSQRGLADVSAELTDRLISLFRPGTDGRRPGDPRDVGAGALWSEHVTFSEYFHGDTGAGLGASHQTGWTALVAHLICSATPRHSQAQTPTS